MNQIRMRAKHLREENGKEYCQAHPKLGCCNYNNCFNIKDLYQAEEKSCVIYCKLRGKKGVRFEKMRYNSTKKLQRKPDKLCWQGILF